MSSNFLFLFRTLLNSKEIDDVRGEQTTKSLQIPNYDFPVSLGKSESAPKISTLAISTTETITINQISAFKFILIPGLKIQVAAIPSKKFANSVFLNKFNELGIVDKIFLINNSKFILQIFRIIAIGSKRTEMPGCIPSHSTWSIRQIDTRTVFWELSWILNKGIPIIRENRLHQVVLLPSQFGND